MIEMLMLARKEGSFIQVGNDIRVYFNGVTAEGWAKIGIQAPDDILIARSEILRKMMRDEDGNLIRIYNKK